METQIVAEACGVSRKDVPWDEFHSIYLHNFKANAQPDLTIEAVQKIGKGSWEESPFWERLHGVLSNKVHCLGLGYISQTFTNLLNRFFVTLSYSTMVIRHYATLTGVKRCLPNQILFFMSVGSLLN